MTPCSPGDVVLVLFPFTDLTSSKKRPGVVLSSSDFSAHFGDVVVLALTSQPQADDSLRMSAWRESGLPKPTWFKPLIATLSADVIIKRLGVLAPIDQPGLINAVRLLISPQFRS